MELYLSRNDMRIFTLCLGLLFILLCFSTGSYSKEACKKQLNKLHHIQAKQREGHSFKRSNTLNDQERKARKNWWQCKKSPTKKRSKKKVKKKKKPRQIKLRKTIYSSLDKSPAKKVKAPEFRSSGVISIKEKFQGKKKYAWLEYYQQPEKCKRPKNLSMFAYCSEDRQMQQLNFEQSYQNVQ